MLKDFFAIYGAMRLLSDVSKMPPDNGGGDNHDNAGCGCLLLFFLILFLIELLLKTE